MELIDKKDVIILWNVVSYEEDQKQFGKIKELEVFEMLEFDDEFENQRQERRLLNIEKKYSYTLGNCNANWKQYNLRELLVVFWVDYQFINKEVSKKAEKELMKIKEFKQELIEIAKIVNPYNL